MTFLINGAGFFLVFFPSAGPLNPPATGVKQDIFVVVLTFMKGVTKKRL